MAQVQTVTGLLAPEAIGPVLMHEHLMSGLCGWQFDPTLTFDPEYAHNTVVKELKEAKQAGAGLVVDVTGIATGRDVDFLERVSAASGLPVVACTGFLCERGMPNHFWAKSVDQLEELFVRELTQGMGRTNIRAGIIKIGTMGEHMTPLEHRLFQAAARASKRTGAAITTHVSSTLPSPVGVISAREQLKVLLEEEGLDPLRVIIGHCDAIRWADYHLEVASTGAYVQFDHICDEEGIAYSLPDPWRVGWVLNLLKAGYERQLLFSSDRIVHDLSSRRQRHYTLSSLFRRFLPMLKEAGVEESTMRTIMVENPQRVLPMP